jgi:serine protease inhibitor
VQSEDLHVDDLVEANNRLAWKLHLGQPADVNVLVAPLPVLLELRKLTAGAKGETLRELQAASGVSEDVQLEGYQTLFRQLESEVDYTDRPARSSLQEHQMRQECALNLCSALWIDERVTLGNSLVQELLLLMSTEIEWVDFNDRAKVERRVGMWLRRTLRQEVGRVELPELAGGFPGVVGVTALRLQSAWSSPFSPDLTEDAEYHGSADRRWTVRMMRRKSRFLYAQDEHAQVVSIRANGGIEVLFVLPRAEADLSTLERRLPSGLIDGYRDQREWQMGTVRVPRFAFRSSLDVAASLRAMGVERAFDPKRAQLGGSTNDLVMPLVASRQQSFFSIDEQGICAGAMSSSLRAAGSSDEPFEFTANRPFLIVVRHQETGAVLFSGRYAGPE